MRKTLMLFVRENRVALDAEIRRADSDARFFGDVDRRRVVLTDGAWHTRARREGVQI
jgi:hypothetical protein